ncbi:hypothetical protein PPR23_004426 [Salmonella enterica]|uniref:Uncharacterized protein n=1 Tax=Salmonella diarizonae TaxID=59204 RepID=A0A6Y5LTN1_SALDZ|nr:hypothetical protein [Salmonella enterica]ECJ2516699.1 hypothetical protein [Salmonella enterica subsp. diarizonae]EIF6674581.1 hypothetical protein [Salmonella enterica]EJA3685553.1 hypothetical protein [Salmonella enterica]EKK8486860.1 hypothetical protein [Salmonella enterica]
MNDVYKAVMDKTPEWSNWISHEQNTLSIKVSLDSNNATVEIGRLHKRTAELEAKLETADRDIVPLLCTESGVRWV